MTRRAMRFAQWTSLAAVLVTVASLAPSASAVPIANSVTDFSGVQGQANWNYGYFNYTADGPTYEVADFQQFPTAGAYPRFAFNGGTWDYLASAGTPVNPPWTQITNTAGHPNSPHVTADPVANQEQWPIRRYTIEDLGLPSNLLVTYTVNWNISHGGSGNGTTTEIYLDGVQKVSQAVDGNAVSSSFTIPMVQVGSVAGKYLDQALTPVGPGGQRDDGSDTTTWGMNVDLSLAMGTQVARIGVGAAPNEFSGNQGQDNWHYGYFDRTADLAGAGSGAYDDSKFTAFLGGAASADPFGPLNHWNGTSWDYVTPGGATNPPWTNISAGAMHPADSSPGPEQYAVLRWVSEVDGAVEVEGFFNNISANDDGTNGRIYLNGVEVFAALTDGTTANFDLLLAISPGDRLDFMVDTGNADNDGTDNTAYSITITAGKLIVPEPATAGLALLALAGFAGRRRKRTA